MQHSCSGLRAAILLHFLLWLQCGQLFVTQIQYNLLTATHKGFVHSSEEEEEGKSERQVAHFDLTRDSDFDCRCQLFLC